MTLLCFSSSVRKKEIDPSFTFQGQDSVHTFMRNFIFSLVELSINLTYDISGKFNKHNHFSSFHIFVYFKNFE